MTAQVVTGLLSWSLERRKQPAASTLALWCLKFGPAGNGEGGGGRGGGGGSGCPGVVLCDHLLTEGGSFMLIQNAQHCFGEGEGGGGGCHVAPFTHSSPTSQPCPCVRTDCKSGVIMP